MTTKKQTKYSVKISTLNPAKLLNRGWKKVSTVADKYKIPTSSLSSAIARGHLPGIQTTSGRKTYWVKPKDVQRWIDQKYKPNKERVTTTRDNQEESTPQGRQTTSIDFPVFLYEEHSIRAGLHAGEPVFCIADICDALDLKRTHGPIQTLRDHGQWVVILSVTTALPMGSVANQIGSPSLAFTNLSGVNFLAFRSRKPEALKLQKWVTSEVLPSIYRTGSYSITGDHTLTLLQSMVSQMTQNAKVLEETLGQIHVANQRLDALENSSFLGTQEREDLGEEQKKLEKTLKAVKKELRALKNIPEFEESLVAADQPSLRALSNRIVKSLAGAKTLEIQALYPYENEPIYKLLWDHIYKTLLHSKPLGNIDLKRRKQNAIKGGKKNITALGLATPKELATVFVVILKVCESFDYRPAWFQQEPLINKFFEIRDLRKEHSREMN